ncbi:MAG: thioredoxin domain-containing protein, partial [Candidatus Kaiserbacteria bacterium]|nr:thioredoxin domain-containing protein [Candidatus Kaiserbacteria bacterium]
NKAAYDAAANADKTEGANFGIQGTPGFITGKTLIPGAVDYSQFKSAIDAQL